MDNITTKLAVGDERKNKFLKKKIESLPSDGNMKKTRRRRDVSVFVKSVE